MQLVRRAWRSVSVRRLEGFCSRSKKVSGDLLSRQVARAQLWCSPLPRAVSFNQAPSPPAVSYYFPPRTMLRSFWCAMIAAMTLKMFDPFGSGKIVLFAVTYDKVSHHCDSHLRDITR